MHNVVVSKSSSGDDSVALFPSEDGGGVQFSLAETNGQNRAFARFYVELIEAAEGLYSPLGIEASLSPYLLRAALVPLAHSFFERLLRLERLLQAEPGVREVMSAPPLPCPIGCEDLFTLATHSFEFNQCVLARVAPLLGLGVSAQLARCPSTQALPEFDRQYRNYMFSVLPPTTLTRALRKARRAWSRRVGTVIAFSLTYTDFPSLDARLYGWGKFAALREPGKIDAGVIDADLRRSIFADSRGRLSQAIGRFLQQCSVAKPVAADSIADVFRTYCADFFPRALLEGAPANLRSARSELLAYPRCKVIYSTSFSMNTRPVYLSVAARSLGMSVIGSQHGGHHGYTEEQTLAFETEYPFCDRFVTWGWSETDPHPAFANSMFIPLPSPWYSEQARQWRIAISDADRFDSGKPIDIALFPNKVSAYCSAPSGAHVTANFLPKFAATLVDLMRFATKDGLKVLHKPFGMSTLELMPRTLDVLARIGGGNYELSRNIDKGLHPELVRRCKLFVWDQPGSGFIECLVADIPTMVLWPRIFSCESQTAAPIIAALESVGIIHRTPESLVGAARDFLKQPGRWWRDARRQEAARAFTHAYGRAVPDWADRWQAFIRELTFGLDAEPRN